MQEYVFTLIIYWIGAAIATERVTEIIHDSKLFEPIRSLIAELNDISCSTLESDKNTSNFIVYKIYSFLNSILSCSWCLSVWVSLFFTIITPYKIVVTTDGTHTLIYSVFPNFLVAWFALVGLSNTWHAIFRLIYNGRVKTVDLTINRDE